MVIVNTVVVQVHCVFIQLLTFKAHELVNCNFGAKKGVLEMEGMLFANLLSPEG